MINLLEWFRNEIKPIKRKYKQWFKSKIYVTHLSEDKMILLFTNENSIQLTLNKNGTYTLEDTAGA
jgi:hypothetical protein